MFIQTPPREAVASGFRPNDRPITRHKTLAWGAVLVLMALIVPVVQLIVGVSMAGANRAHDGNFAVFTFLQYKTEIYAGSFLPRWSGEAYGGLGSPIFFFYPPGAYLFTTLLSLFMPGLPAAGVIGVAQIVLRATAILACFAWVRRHTTREAALIGSGLYALMPWVCLNNPQVRLDFAECAAATLVPLCFLAVDLARGRVLALILLVAAAMAAMTLVHLPTMVVTAGLVFVYALLSTDSLFSFIKRAVIMIGSTLLGLGIAGWYLIPALGLLPAISASALWDTKHRPEDHFVLALNTLHRGGLPFNLLFNAGLLVPLGMVALFVGSMILAARRLPIGLMSLHGVANQGSVIAVSSAFLVAAFMATPLSLPVWLVITPLSVIQFPGRFLMPASLLAMALIAIVLPGIRPRLQRLAILIGLVLGTASVLIAVGIGDGMSSYRFRTEQAVSHHADAPEYVPVGAGSHGWLALAQQGADMPGHAATLVSTCLRKLPKFGLLGNRPLTFTVNGCAGPTVLPQFYFPGWVAEADGHTVPVVDDIPSGLIKIDVPAATATVSLHRTWLKIEKWGVMVSTISVGSWLGLLCVLLLIL